jgi:hypothetical protein
MQLFTGLGFLLQQQLALIGTGSSGDKHRDTLDVLWVTAILFQKKKVWHFHAYPVFYAADPQTSTSDSQTSATVLDSETV